MKCPVCGYSMTPVPVPDWYYCLGCHVERLFISLSQTVITK